jgi:hypothetical protein
VTVVVVTGGSVYRKCTLRSCRQYGDHNCVPVSGTACRCGLIPVSAKHHQGSPRKPSESFTWSAILSYCWFLITLRSVAQKRCVRRNHNTYIHTYIHTEWKRNLSDRCNLRICKF